MKEKNIFSFGICERMRYQSARVKKKKKNIVMKQVYL